jgi:putative DNA primase/helicase
LDFDDGAKICPTITFCEGPDGQRRWAAKRMPAPFPLQGLDDLAARPDDWVLLVSGEKCRQGAAEHMHKFVVCTWMGGDQAVGSADIRPLLGRHIVLWADADPSSKRSMIDMFNRIEKAGTG